MGVHWDAAFTRWQPHMEDDKLFSLAHLDCFNFTVEMPVRPPHPQRVVKIQAGFSSHCFTTKWANAATALGIYENPRERRWFELERYELSPLLPDIVRTLPRRKIYFTDDGSFLTIELTGSPPNTTQYRVFFNLRRFEKESGTLLLVVRSAFPSSQEFRLRGRDEAPIRFNALLQHALSGTKPRKMS